MLWIWATTKSRSFIREKIAELESQLTGDMFKDMDIMDQIPRLKLECVGGTCSIDEPECEACGG